MLITRQRYQENSFLRTYSMTCHGIKNEKLGQI
jgi:hypothetical protein